jgi:rhodanese-related sulfurtransferase
MRRTSLIMATALCLVSATQVFAFDNIAPEEAMRRLQSNETILVDVRTPQEWKQTGVAPGAKAIDAASPSFGADLKTVIDANPGKTLTFICRSGQRSAAVAGRLETAGMSHLAHVEGGMNAWLDDGLPVETR